MLNYYQQQGKGFSADEMWGADAQAKPHWLKLLQHLQAMGEPELLRRQGEMQRLLLENGVTYNIYNTQKPQEHPWRLDPIPLIFSASDWETLSDGLHQRAHLLNMVLRDLYGSRSLMQAGLLPASIIFSDPAFLRPCDQLLVHGPHQLLMYGTDLAKGADGRFWVMEDRTQSPAGWGYAMESRTVMARVLPELFQNVSVRKLAGFFSQSQEAIAGFMPQLPTPRTVLLTPGPLNETYFEHAFLSTFLGYTLVQGQDLMVKDDCLWLKTLGGLEKVDIVLRRVDDNFCDPLAFRGDSHLGVPGLLEVARKGNVCVANPFGSGILQNPAIMSCLPEISQYFLGEPLLLPQAPSWWCGKPQQQAHVLANLEKLVVKTIDRRSPDVKGWELSKTAADQLRKQIKAAPYLYVAQELIAYGTSPSMADSGQLEPRATLFRSFMIASNNGYKMMPGGLARSAPALADLQVANQMGGISKDTWVLSKEQQQPIAFQSQPQLAATPIFKGIEELPSRTGENLYWIGRYLVRLMRHASMLRTVYWMQGEANNFAQESDKQSLQLILQALTQVTMTYPGFVGKDAAKLLQAPAAELRAVVIDDARAGSLANTISLWMFAIQAVRDRWSMDTWRIVNNVDRTWRELRKTSNPSPLALRGALDQLVTELAAFKGMDVESMTGEEGRFLFDIGRRIEQVIQLSALMRATIVSQQDEAVEQSLLTAILRSNDSLASYRYRYRSQVQLPSVLNMMLFDISYPGSAVYMLQHLNKRLSQLPKRDQYFHLREDQRLALDAFTKLRLANLNELLACEEGAVVRKGLDALLGTLYTELSSTSDAIYATYFTHVSSEQQSMGFYSPEL